MADITNDRQQTSTTPEDLFADLFASVFGLQKTQLLVPQHPIDDIYGTTRYIDFALRTVADRIAFEIDGLTWHVPDPERVRDYEDGLLRQNSLIHLGWRVFRWTDRQIADAPERVNTVVWPKTIGASSMRCCGSPAPEPLGTICPSAWARATASGGASTGGPRAGAGRSSWTPCGTTTWSG